MFKMVVGCPPIIVGGHDYLPMHSAFISLHFLHSHKIQNQAGHVGEEGLLQTKANMLISERGSLIFIS